MISLQTYVRQGRTTLRKWALDPTLHTVGRAMAYVLSGFALSAASLGNTALPLAFALVCACSGWSSLLCAAGGILGYLLFWGNAGWQCVVWLPLGAAVALLLADRPFTRQASLLIPAIASLIVAATGVVFQLHASDATPIPLYLLRTLLAGAGAWLFGKVLRERSPILDWLACGLCVLALAQICPIPYFGFGFIAAGALAVASPFPAAALAGLALDLAQVTPVPMTAVMTLAFFVRLLPRCPKHFSRSAPALVYILIMALGNYWDLLPLPALLLGSIAGSFLPAPGQATHRRGETGVAQVRLEVAAGVLAQTEQLLLEIPQVPVDEEALIARAAERACGSCPCRKSCKDSKRIALLPGALLHKPLHSTEELPLVCRKSGRFLAELHRSQEQLRSIQWDREQQKEYRAAVVQQYRFLSEYLQDLSDQLARRTDSLHPQYTPHVSIHANRPQSDNGDRCVYFSGVMCKYYVLLCDGMGTGLGAVQEGRTATGILRKLLSAGYPAEYALRSLNSLCALRSRAGAVTVDLLELQLDCGRATLYKWGAPASYLVCRQRAQKIGSVSPPPGLSVTDRTESADRFSMRQGELLLMVSDGIGEDEALQCCSAGNILTPKELSLKLLTYAQLGSQDDATVVTVHLDDAP